MDANIDQSDKECQKTLAQLRSVVNDVNIFTQRDQAIDFLTEINDIKAFLIVEGTIGQHIVSLIYDIPQLDAIYIFCENKSGHEAWTKRWVKIKHVYTEIPSICQSLQQAAKQCDQDSIAVSFVKVNEARLENEYHAKSAIWWYNCAPFIYSIFNCVLHMLEADTIITMGFFIHDLQQQIEELHKKQIESYHGKSFIVCWGRGLFKKKRTLKNFWKQKVD